MPNVQPANPINIETTRAPKNHSNFDLSRFIGLTPRFGVNTPFYSEEVVPDDGPIIIEPSCDTRSYTLKAPMFGDIKKHVAFYQVPLQAILPINWEKIVVNASKGSDVQGDSTSGELISSLDGVNCVVSDFPRRICEFFTSDFRALKLALAPYTGTWTNADVIQSALLFVARWEMFFSHGSLLSCLGVHYGHLLKFNRFPSTSATAPTSTLSFDGFSQTLLSAIEHLEFSISDSEGISIRGVGASFVRRALDFIRSHSGPFTFEYFGLSGGSPTSININLFELVDYSADSTEPLNFGRLVAYQIVNAHYYSNDKVDYIYSADLYRQYIGSLIMNPDFIGSPAYFSYNGISCLYDWLSGFYLNTVIDISNFKNYLDPDVWTVDFPYLNAIFGFNYSLRFIDYFVGARPRNLAISGPNTPTNVQVENGAVSVINTTKSIVAQRFLNAVARAGQSIESYSSKVLGRYIAPDWHNPKYLFSFDVNIFNSEIENTGAAQQTNPNSVTSVLRGKAGGLQFTFDIDRHSFIVGIEYFDVRRFYYTTQDKNTMAIDRFDMFIPELQYIGDQSLKLSELIAGADKDIPFGYQLKDMQFKQSYDICSGGFVENLPGWLMAFDPRLDYAYSAMDSNIHIGPEFIRSHPTELDRFYLSLTGLTLASYFHFIELWHVKVSANRPMVYAPQIL